MEAAEAGISEDDLYLFNQGFLYHSYRTFGAHIMKAEGKWGVRFVVWAPHAKAVGLAGDFNDWNAERHAMQPINTTGVWWLFVAGMTEGEMYKYEIITASGHKLLKSDPFAFYAERRPGTASIVKPLDRYKWHDEEWLGKKREQPSYNRPLLIYEVHLGSWKIKGKEHFYTYEELAFELVDYAANMGFTHIELLPITEHPFDRSWGYQTTGYYAATSRYGEPDQLMRMIDRCHEKGIGVILDWVPGHFCRDDHGLRLFDGTPIYEGSDPKRADKPQWGTLAFDFGCAEVQSFLISNAIFWMDVYHMDGIRVDAVASMIDLHLEKPIELYTWNEYGGHENLDALHFLKKLNEAAFQCFPETLMIAEDSSSSPAVTSPTYLGGFGFNFKWNMGWMNDMLRYMELDPTERIDKHHLITFSLMYAFNENYVLPLSHDEVVHGKRSLLNKMPGSYAEKFAQLRLFYGYWMTHPGKKLLFMGSEWGQFDEWKDMDQLDWNLHEYDMHRSMQHYSLTLNHLYQEESSLWERDSESSGFEWLDVNNAEQSIIAFLRHGFSESDLSIVVCNFSKNDHLEYRLGVPDPGYYEVVLNSSDERFGGNQTDIAQGYAADKQRWHGRDYSIMVKLPAFVFLLIKPARQE